MRYAIPKKGWVPMRRNVLSNGLYFLDNKRRYRLVVLIGRRDVNLRFMEHNSAEPRYPFLTADLHHLSRGCLLRCPCNR